MNIIWILVIALLLLAILGAPGMGVWQHNYGYWPSGGAALIVLVLLVVLLFGRP